MVWAWDIETHTPIPPKKKRVPPDAYAPGSRILTAAMVDGQSMLGVFVDHPEAPDTTGLAAMEAILYDPHALVVGHNILSFDAVWWGVHRKPIRARMYDTRVLHSLLDPEAPNGLDVLGVQYFGWGKRGQDLDIHRLIEEDPAQVLAYNLADAHLTFRLYVDEIVPRLEAQGMDMLADLVMRTGRILLGMTLRGVAIDEAWVERQRQEIHQQLDGLDEQLAAFGLNPRSPQQIGEFLYQKLGAPVVKSTPSGQPSTDEETLKLLRQKTRGEEARNLLTSLLDHRSLSKLWGTYLKKLLETHRKSDGRVHPTVHIGRTNTGRGRTGTITGRLSMSNPNLQNQPRDHRIRGAFIPSEGFQLFEADYSQIELRVAAWLSKEAGLLDAFRAGRDAHTETLARIQRVTYEEAVRRVESGTWKEERSLVKQINFATLYGGSAYTIQRVLRTGFDMEIHLARIQRMRRDWFAALPTLSAWITEVEDRAIREGQLVTPFGRVRPLAGASRDSGRGRTVLRQGVNFLVQSTAADLLLCLALPQLDLEGVPLLLTVHDSIIGEYRPVEAYLVRDAIRRAMTTETIKLAQKLYPQYPWEDLPLGVDITIGLDRWGG